jgi:flagellin-like protein
MFKKMWKDEQAVSPVIATILMVAITVVLAGVLVVYMQQFSKGPGTTVPTASTVPTPFTNPVDGTQTSNGGGWSVRVAAISNAPGWGSVTVQVTKDNLPVSKMTAVKAGTGVLWQSNGTGIPKWWAKSGVAGVTAMRYSPAGAAKIVPAPGAAGTGVAVADLQTFEQTSFIVVDVDGSNSMTAGDLVMVFANSAGGTTAQIGGTGYQLEFAMGGTTICSSELA